LTDRESDAYTALANYQHLLLSQTNLKKKKLLDSAGRTVGRGS